LFSNDFPHSPHSCLVRRREFPWESPPSSCLAWCRCSRAPVTNRLLQIVHSCVFSALCALWWMIRLPRCANCFSQTVHAYGRGFSSDGWLVAFPIPATEPLVPGYAHHIRSMIRAKWHLVLRGWWSLRRCYSQNLSHKNTRSSAVAAIAHQCSEQSKKFALYAQKQPQTINYCNGRNIVKYQDSTQMY